MERETGIEPATNGLGSRDSTTELLPLSVGRQKSNTPELPVASCRSAVTQEFVVCCLTLIRVIPVNPWLVFFLKLTTDNRPLTTAIRGVPCSPTCARVESQRSCTMMFQTFSEKFVSELLNIAASLHIPRRNETHGHQSPPTSMVGRAWHRGAGPRRPQAHLFA